MPARILIIDDDASVLVLLKKVLEHDGHSVDVTADPEMALRCVASARYDLLLVDKRLPGTNGLELITRARRAWADLPAILITAYPEPILGPTVKLQGYLAKPFESMAKVSEAVARALWLREVRAKSAPQPALHG